MNCRAATAGAISSATMRIAPTARMPSTIATTSSAVIAISRTLTGSPTDAAKPASNSVIFSARKATATTARLATQSAAMTSRSRSSMPAAWPNRYFSSPAWLAFSPLAMNVSSTMPRLKKTDSTTPIAASGRIRPVRSIATISSARDEPGQRGAGHERSGVLGPRHDEGDRHAGQGGVRERVADEAALPQHREDARARPR